MKKIIGMILLLGITFGLFADVYWETDGIPVRQGVNIEWTRSSVVMDDGSIVYVWSDTRDGDRDIFGQKIDADGNPVWGENSGSAEYPEMTEGIKINGEVNRQEDIVAINVGDGNVIVAWIDFRNEHNGDVYAQKLNSDGEIQWDSAGVPLCLISGTQISLNIVNDANGGIYLVWYDNRNPGGTDIYGTHLLGDGTIAPGWSVDGDPIVDASGGQNQHTFWEDGTGGAILAWHDERNADDENIYIQRIASNGDLLWGENGTLLTNTPGVQEKPKVAPDTDGNFVFAWIDKSVDVSGGNLRAMKVDLDGNNVWANETIIYAGDGVQRNPRLGKNSEGGVFAVWEDGRNNSEFKDIYAQKINSDGTLAWDAAGVEVTTNENDQLNPRLTHDGNGGCWFIWDDGRLLGHPYEDIYVQRLNSAGVAEFETGGKFICNAIREQFSPLIKRNSEGGYLVTWGDNRSGSTGIYMQLLNSAGVEQFPENGKVLYFGLSGDAKDYTIIENEENPIVIWKDTRDVGIKQIYMQVVNSDGTFQLIENGIPFTTFSGVDQDNFSSSFDDEDDVIALVWQETRGDFNQVYAQAIDIDGTSLWDSTGLYVAEFPSAEQIEPKISLANDGSYYIGWSDFRDDWNFGIVAQKVIDGVTQWDAEGVIIADETGDEKLNAIIDNYFIWQGGSWGNSNIFIKRIADDGSTFAGWDDDAVEVCGENGDQTNARALKVEQGILIVWDDLRNGNLDIYGQLVSNDGELLWADGGIALSAMDNDQALGNIRTHGDDIYAVWADLRDGQWDVYAQNYDMNGTEQWTADGLGVATTEAAEQAPYIVGNSTSNVIFWEGIVEDGSESESNLFAQLLDENGNLIWDAEGEVISSAIRNQNAPMAAMSADDVVVIWEDTRSSGKTDIYNVYAQKLGLGLDSPETTVPANTALVNQNYPNPFNPTTTITYSLPENSTEDFKLYIYNVKGQLVNSLKAGENSVTWNGKDSNGSTVSNGIYFYRLESDSIKSSPRKMILLK